MTDLTRAHWIMACGIAIILLGVGAALSPAVDELRGSSVIGALLLGAGIVEMFAGTLRQQVHKFAIAAGAVTALTGLFFILSPRIHFFESVTPVIGWLLVRSLILAWTSRHTGGAVRTWTGLSAGIDLLLAILLVAGLSIATLVVSVFGPTAPLIATFSWVLAASFVVTGNLLLEVAHCERSSA